METAKVDIRRLQLLNDRINQTIDALNQVRLSVHGISHAAGSPYGLPALGYPGALGAAPYGLPGAFPLQGGLPGVIPSLSHTAGLGGLLPQAYGLAGLQNPWLVQNPWLAQSVLPGVVNNGFLQQGGLGHTGSEWLESGLGHRQALAQAFPFAQWSYSPFASPL